MQAIFGFGGNQLVDWNVQVLQQFRDRELQPPLAMDQCRHTTARPMVAGLQERPEVGGNVDLPDGAARVTWIQLQHATADRQRLSAALTRSVTPQGQVLVIGDSRNPRGRRQMASQTPGATAVEPVDLADLTSFGSAFNPEAPDALGQLVQFAAETT